MQYPPYPNLDFNFNLATEKNGYCYLRYDDTNPLTEEQIYIDSILENIHICSWLPFLLIKGIDPERPIYKLSPFALNNAIVSILGYDPLSMKRLSNGNVFVKLSCEIFNSFVL